MQGSWTQESMSICQWCWLQITQGCGYYSEYSNIIQNDSIQLQRGSGCGSQVLLSVLGWLWNFVGQFLQLLLQPQIRAIFILMPMMLARLVVMMYLMMDLLDLVVVMRLLIHGAEVEIHHKDQPRDHDRYKQNRSVLRFGVLLKLSDEVDEQLPAVDNLSEHDGHRHHEERHFSARRAQGRVDVVGQDKCSAVLSATRAVHVLALDRSIVRVASKDLEYQRALEYDQSPRNDEPELRLNEEHLPAVLAPQSDDGDQHRAAGETDNADCFKLICSYSGPCVPGHIVADPAEEVQGDAAGNQRIINEIPNHLKYYGKLPAQIKIKHSSTCQRRYWTTQYFLKISLMLKFYADHDAQTKQTTFWLQENQRSSLAWMLKRVEQVNDLAQIFQLVFLILLLSNFAISSVSGLVLMMLAMMDFSQLENPSPTTRFGLYQSIQMSSLGLYCSATCCMPQSQSDLQGLVPYHFIYHSLESEQFKALQMQEVFKISRVTAWTSGVIAPSLYATAALGNAKIKQATNKMRVDCIRICKKYDQLLLNVKDQIF